MPGAPRGTGRAETAGYAAAVVIIIGGGALLTTPILNWLVGPAITVVCVWAAGRLAERRNRRREGEQ